jgi:hypothetical protein
LLGKSVAPLRMFILPRNLRFSHRWWRRFKPSGMLRGDKWWRVSDVSETLSSFLGWMIMKMETLRPSGWK